MRFLLRQPGFRQELGIPTVPGPQEAFASTLFRGVSPEQLWAEIRPPEAALKVGGPIDAYVEPGTGPGLGEIQVFVRMEEGRRVETRIQVVEVLAPTLARTIILDAPYPMGNGYLLEQRRRGTLFTFSAWAQPPLGTHIPGWVESHRTFATSWFAALKSSLKT